jgi:alkanesulfonate monooxygenase SsuD/methylene tetrahydromethanopterin reductase-like flavin-dependent oxidoreductase (luciferase family)
MIAGRLDEGAISWTRNSAANASSSYADLKSRAAALGRNPDHITVLPGLTPIIADTDEEAQAIAEAQLGALDLKSCWCGWAASRACLRLADGYDSGEKTKTRSVPPSAREALEGGRMIRA